MDRTPTFLRGVATKKLASHGKSGHEARATGFNVPILRYLASIFFIEHRIEDRLLGQPWWKFPEAAGRDQLQLFWPDGPIEDCGFCVHAEQCFYSTSICGHSCELNR